MIEESISGLIETWDEEHPYQPLITGALKSVTPDAAGLYVIDPSMGSHRLVGYEGTVGLPQVVPAAPHRGREEESARIGKYLREAVFSIEGQTIRGIQLFTRLDPEGLILGLLHERTVFAFFRLVTREKLSAKRKEEFQAKLKLAFLIFQDLAARRALRAQFTPVDIDASRDDFYLQVRTFLRDASGMQFIALRELGHSDERNLLTCTVMSGWNNPNADFDLYNYPQYEPFRKAVEEKTPTFSPDRSDPALSEFWEAHPQLRDVQSFAVFPIQDGDHVIGVLSAASSCRLDFTGVLRSVIGGIARSVGVSLVNRRLRIEKDDLRTNAIETANSLNVVELFSDLTHQFRNRLTTIQEGVELLEARLSKKGLTSDDIPPGIEDSLDGISDLLHQASDITRLPDDQLSSVLISDIWKQAVDLVEYRLDKYGIDVSRRGDARVDVYPVLLRQVFFHLLTNSVKSFADRSKTQNRKIVLRVTEDKSSHRLQLRYVDNAGGINPADLRQRVGGKASALRDIPNVREVVFQRGVSGKRDGTGHGLWISRQIVQRHRGDIELTGYREGGVSFTIVLPVNLREILSPRKVM